jgi:hypothetical protein
MIMNSPGSSIAEFNFDRREHFFVPYSSFHHADDRYMLHTTYIILLSHYLLL